MQLKSGVGIGFRCVRDLSNGSAESMYRVQFDRSDDRRNNEKSRGLERFRGTAFHVSISWGSFARSAMLKIDPAGLATGLLVALLKAWTNSLVDVRFQNAEDRLVSSDRHL